jgi:hypothetical protein
VARSLWVPAMLSGQARTEAPAGAVEVWEPGELDPVTPDELEPVLVLSEDDPPHPVSMPAARARTASGVESRIVRPNLPVRLAVFRGISDIFSAGMTSLPEYLGGLCLLLILVCSLGIAATRIRSLLMPQWSGAVARLVEIIIAVGLLILLAEVLGALGILFGWLLVLEALLVAVLSLTFPVPRHSAAKATLTAEPTTALTRGMSVAALAVVAVVFIQWSLAVKLALDGGMFNFDTLWTNMPLAAQMAQSHSVVGLHYTGTVFTNWSWLYPENSELTHAVGILLLGRDTLSPLLNLAWLLLAFLAAWCIGSPYGRGPLSVAGVAVILDAETMLVREAGTAKTDVMAAAFLLAAVAVLVNAWCLEDRKVLTPGWPVAAAGLAVGIAAGAKPTVLPTSLALTVAVLALAPTARRLQSGLWWFAAAVAGGGFWYLRNLIVAGNPVPQLSHLGPVNLPHPGTVQHEWPNYGVLHYITDGSVWSHFFEPGFKLALGSLWPLVLALALCGGVALMIWGREKLLRWLGVAVLVGAVSYTVTPLTAGGPEGSPINFWLNVRYLVPTLLVAFAAAPALTVFKETRAQVGLLATLVIILVATDGVDQVVQGHGQLFAAVLCLLVVVLPTAILYYRRKRSRPNLRFAVEVATVVVVAAILGYFVQREYLRHRFVSGSGIPGYGMEAAYNWAQDLSHQRIGLAGTTAGFVQYGFFGRDLSNTVTYLGETGSHGAYNPIPNCRAFRAAVNSARLDYLVTAPFLNFWEAGEPIASPEAMWLRGDPAVVQVSTNSGIAIWRIRGTLDPQGCSASLNAPLEFVPQQPQAISLVPIHGSAAT